MGRQPGSGQSHKEGVLVGWQPDGFRRLDTYRGVKQKSKYIEDNKSPYFSLSKGGDTNMGRRKPKMSPLVLEWNWSYHCELRVADMHGYRNKYKYMYMCMYIHMLNS